jgi:hypothetical protein
LSVEGLPKTEAKNRIAQILNPESHQHLCLIIIKYQFSARFLILYLFPLPSLPMQHRFCEVKNLPQANLTAQNQEIRIKNCFGSPSPLLDSYQVSIFSLISGLTSFN